MEESKKKETHYYSQIWVEPRDTIHRIVQENPNKMLWLLSFVYGFSEIIRYFYLILIGQQIGIVHILILAASFGIIWGYVGFNLFSGLITLTGKIFGGKATFKENRAAFAWSCVPYSVNVAIWIVLCALFGRDLFMGIAESRPISQMESAALFVGFAVRAIMWVWSWVIYVNALSKVQNFSILKTIGNITLSIIILGGIFYFLVFFGVHGAHGVAASINNVKMIGVNL